MPAQIVSQLIILRFIFSTLIMLLLTICRRLAAHLRPQTLRMRDSSCIARSITALPDCSKVYTSGNTERQWNLVFRLYPARERKILRNLPLLDFDGPDLPDRRRRRVSFLLASGKKWSKEQCHNGSTQAAR